MIYFLRSYILRTDSRLLRYTQACEARNLTWHAICWDKDGTETDRENVTHYNLRAKIGGGMRNIFSLALWNLFLFRNLVASRKSITAVHAIDFDTLLPALIFCKLFGKRFVFDVYDKYTDVRSIGGTVGRLIDKLERFGCKQADLLLLPDECRVAQLSISDRSNLLIIENVPIYSGISLPIAISEGFAARLAYVGTLEPNSRGLEDLICEVSRRPNITLDIAGVGPVSDLCEEYANSFKNIVFHGAVSPSEAMELMSRSHIVVGMYYLTVPNHRFAAPNKYFEHLALGRPLLTTKGTPPGERVVVSDTGWAIAEGQVSLSDFFDSISPDEIRAKGLRARKVWLEGYSEYFNHVIVGRYAEFLEQGN